MIEHVAYYFGTVAVQLPTQTRDGERSNEEKVIDQIENAQLEGRLPRDARDAQRVVVRLSKHGMQIMTPDRRLTVARVALLNILFTVAFDDGFGKYNCAVIERGREESGQCYVFLLPSRQEADSVMKDVDALFNRVQEECLDFETAS